MRMPGRCCYRTSLNPASTSPPIAEKVGQLSWRELPLGMWHISQRQCLLRNDLDRDTEITAMMYFERELTDCS